MGECNKLYSISITIVVIRPCNMHIFVCNFADLVIQNQRQSPTSLDITWQLIQVARNIGLPAAGDLIHQHVLVLRKGTV